MGRRISWDGALGLAAGLVALIGWVGCEGSGHGQDPGAGHDHGKEHAHAPAAPGADDAGHAHPEPEGICLEGEAQQFDLAWQVVEPRDHFPALKIPGSVMVDPDRRVTVAAPLAGRVVQLEVRPHASVEPGQRLVVLSVLDQEVRAMQVRAVELRAELAGATTERDRTQTYLTRLERAGANAPAERRRVAADLTVRKARVSSLDSSLTAILAALEGSGLGASQREALAREGKVATRISLRAPVLPGRPELEVAARPVNQGQTVEAGAPLYELVALDRLLVVGEAFEADLHVVRRAMREGLPVSLLFPGTDQRVDGLSVLSMEGAMDSEERLTHFFIPLNNRLLGRKEVDGSRYMDWAHRAGSRVQILVATRAPELRFVLPAEALIAEAGKTVVFREHEGHIEEVPVLVESVDERQVVVPLGAGLMSGDRILVRGALQAALALEHKRAGPAAPGSDHGHSH